MIDSSSPSTILTAMMVLPLAFFLFRSASRRIRRPLPPGPPSYPLIGQLPSILRTTLGSDFLGLGKASKSDIISLSSFGTTTVVLNSAEACINLLGKRTSIYSGRPYFAMVSSPHLMDIQHFMVFMDTDLAWRKQRRVAGAQLNTQAVQKFRSTQDLQGRKLLQRLLSICDNLESSDQLRPEISWGVSEMLFDSVYGYELKSPDDPFLAEVVTMHENLAHSFRPSDFLVNMLPWLQYIPDWVPGTGWKQTAREWREQKNRAMDGIYHWTKERVVSGEDHYSIISSILQEAQQMGWSQAETDTFAKNLGAAFLLGGTVTSILSFMWLVLAMALYPEVQAKAQREIDDVVGSDRLPTFEDQSRLPYVGRVLREVSRWQTVVPLGVPHMCTQDDEYEGYRIPKGSIMIGNVWAICQDAELYKEPDTFNPDRFLDPTVLAPPVFGWGNRACPGRHLFENSYYIQSVLILAAFNIGKQRDDNGQDIEPIKKVAIDSAVAGPAPFKLKMSPRSMQHAELIKMAA